MPNWCGNNMTIYNPKKFKEKCIKNGGFFFDNIVPMPDHMRVKNNLSVDSWMEKQMGGSDHLTPESVRKADKLQNEFFQEDVFDYIAVKPWLKSEEERTGILADSWYEWNCANWGTKWDLAHDDIDLAELDKAIEEGTDYDLSFDTAWAPPIPVLEKMAELGVEFDWSCEESGCQIYMSGTSDGQSFSYGDDEPPEEDDEDEE